MQYLCRMFWNLVAFQNIYSDCFILCFTYFQFIWQYIIFNLYFKNVFIFSIFWFADEIYVQNMWKHFILMMRTLLSSARAKLLQCWKALLRVKIWTLGRTLLCLSENVFIVENIFNIIGGTMTNFSVSHIHSIQQSFSTLNSHAICVVNILISPFLAPDELIDVYTLWICQV